MGSRNGVRGHMVVFEVLGIGHGVLGIELGVPGLG